MVATRIVLVIGLTAIVFAFGLGWLSVSRTDTQFPYFYTVPSLATMVGSYATGHNVTSLSSGFGLSTDVQIVFPPLVLGTWETVVTVFAFPLAFVLNIFAFSRWQYSLWAGVAAILAGASWVAGVSAFSSVAASRLSQLSGAQGTGASFIVGVSVGPYLEIAAGVLLLLTYAFTRRGRFDPPFE